MHKTICKILLFNFNDLFFKLLLFCPVFQGVFCFAVSLKFHNFFFPHSLEPLYSLFCAADSALEFL